MAKLPREAWVDREALIRPTLSAYVSNKNEIEDGVRVYMADQVDREKRMTFILYAVATVIGQVITKWMWS